MVLLGLASIIILILEIVTTLNIAQYTWLGTIDLIVSLIFFGDLFLHYHLSPNKATFFQRHWYDLLAAIPITSAVAIFLTSFQIIPALTLLHIFRLIRLIVRMRILLEVSLEYTRHAYLIYVFTTMSFIIFTGAAGFFFFEFGTNPNVKSYWDAVWWAVVTSTTIGYGDIFPITTGGRIIAIFVMLIGITALGTFIATIDSFLLGRRLKKLKKKK
jgi:voltage-gated potassium channel